MDDNSWEDNLWTDATRAAYLEAGEAAITALRSHLAVVASASSEDDEETIAESAESVRLAYLAVSDAEFNYSSTLAPFSLLELEDDDDDDDDVEQEASVDGGAEHARISIMLRRDYRVTSESALLAAGQAAYAAVPADDVPDVDVEDIQGIGRAIFQLVHTGGLEALNDADGIEPVVGVMLAVGRDDLLTEDQVDELLEEEPGELFAGEGEVIFSQSESWS